MSEAIRLHDLSCDATLQAAIERAAIAVLRSGQYIQGPKVSELEQDLGHFCKVKHAVAVSSGSDALYLSLQALGIGSGDEVITSPFTFFASASAIARVGARPVFVDVDAASLLIKASEIAKAINTKTKAIIAVDLYGQCAAYEEIDSQLNEHSSDTEKKPKGQSQKIALIEDAAQSLGAQRKGKMAGSLASISCLSFYPTKTLGGVGEGGMLLCENAELAEQFRSLRNQGSLERYNHQHLGGNHRMDAIQAVVLLEKLKYLPGWIAKRQAIAESYAKAFVSESSLAEFINPIELVTENQSAYALYVVRAKQRDQLMKHLRENKIECEIHYPKALHLQKAFGNLGYQMGDFPVAEGASSEVLALPMHPNLSENDVERVIQTIKAFYFT